MLQWRQRITWMRLARYLQAGSRDSLVRVRLLLRGEKSEPLLARDPLTRELVIRRKTGRMRRLGRFAVDDLFQRVHTLALLVQVVHEVHGAAPRRTELCSECAEFGV